MADQPITQDNTDVKDDVSQETPQDQKPIEQQTQEEKEATEEKPAEETSTEEKKEKSEEESEGAPESYEQFTVPEGAEIDEAVMGEFQTLAKEFDLSQEKAQKFVDLATKNAQEVADSVVEQQKKHWEGIREEWVKEVKADKEFGADKFDKSLVQAKRALKRFGDEETIKFLDATGFGDHPGLFRLLVRADRATAEDTIVNGEPSVEDTSSAAAVFYKD